MTGRKACDVHKHRVRTIKTLHLYLEIKVAHTSFQEYPAAQNCTQALEGVTDREGLQHLARGNEDTKGQ